MPTTWITRPEAAGDVAAVREIVLAAFDTALEADLVDALRDDPAWIPELSVVTATACGTVLGHALFTRCHVDDVPALALGPCAVRPDAQRTGAGSAAIRSGLGTARRMGEGCVVVLGHPAYYPRFGFGRASVHSIRLSVEVPDDALMVLSLDGRPVPAGLVRYASPFGI